MRLCFRENRLWILARYACTLSRLVITDLAVDHCLDWRYVDKHFQCDRSVFLPSNLLSDFYRYPLSVPISLPSLSTYSNREYTDRAKIQSRFSRKQSLKRKIFILYFRLIFSRRITSFPLVPSVTNHPVYLFYLLYVWNGLKNQDNSFASCSPCSSADTDIKPFYFCFL